MISTQENAFEKIATILFQSEYFNEQFRSARYPAGIFYPSMMDALPASIGRIEMKYLLLGIPIPLPLHCTVKVILSCTAFLGIFIHFKSIHWVISPL